MRKLKPTSQQLSTDADRAASIPPSKLRINPMFSNAQKISDNLSNLLEGDSVNPG